MGTKQIIARSGYSKQDGFEIYFKTHEEHFDKVEMGENLWDTIYGKETINCLHPRVMEILVMLNLTQLMTNLII